MPHMGTGTLVRQYRVKATCSDDSILSHRKQVTLTLFLLKAGDYPHNATVPVKSY